MISIYIFFFSHIDIIDIFIILMFIILNFNIFVAKDYLYKTCIIEYDFALRVYFQYIYIEQ